MPNQKENACCGLIVVLKPMPKQDKEGGINPTFDPRALCPLEWHSGATNFAVPLRRALKQAGNPLFFLLSDKRKTIIISIESN